MSTEPALLSPFRSLLRLCSPLAHPPHQCEVPALPQRNRFAVPGPGMWKTANSPCLTEWGVSTLSQILLVWLVGLCLVVFSERVFLWHECGREMRTGKETGLTLLRSVPGFKGNLKVSPG